MCLIWNRHDACSSRAQNSEAEALRLRPAAASDRFQEEPNGRQNDLSRRLHL
jgi:hypothetical protein